MRKVEHVRIAFSEIETQLEDDVRDYFGITLEELLVERIRQRFITIPYHSVRVEVTLSDSDWERMCKTICISRVTREGRCIHRVEIVEGAAGVEEKFVFEVTYSEEVE